MKKIIVLFMVLSGFSGVYSQDLVPEIQKLTSETNKLQKQIELLTANVLELSRKIQEQQSNEEQQIDEQKARTDKETGDNEILAIAVNDYKNKKFDDLIKTSTKLSVQHDLLLFNEHTELKPLLSELEKYFNAKELLEKKFDATQTNNILTELNEINQQSTLLDKLKEDLKYYKDFNDALKKTVENILIFDGDGPGGKKAGDDARIQELKLKDILYELANYMFNYYDFVNYPYLSDIVLEIIKRKQPDADADIKDLSIRLQ